MRPRRRWNGARLVRVALALLVTGGLLLTATIMAPITMPFTVDIGNPIGFAHTHPAPAAATTTVVLNMTDAPAFVPSAFTVNAGSNVTIDLHNLGNYTHTFTLLNRTQANVTLSTSLTPAQLNAYFNENGSTINESVAPGANATVTYSVPLSSYAFSLEYVSVVPYQFQAGMYGTLSVRPTIGGNATLSDNTTNSLSFVPDVLDLNTSGMHFPINVTIAVTNLGTLIHTFSLVPQPGVNVTPTNFTSYFRVHPALVNVSVTGAGGTGSFLMGGPGVYMYICEEPGHFASGMYGFLYVDVPVPTGSVLSSSIVYAWVLAAALGIVALGVVLSFAAAYIGRIRGPPSGGSPPRDSHY